MLSSICSVTPFVIKILKNIAVSSDVFVYGVWDGFFIGIKNQNEVIMRPVSTSMENTLHQFFKQLDLTKGVSVCAILPWKGALGSCIMQSFHNGFDMFHHTITHYMQWDEVFEQSTITDFIWFHDSKKFLYCYNPFLKKVQEIKEKDLQEFLMQNNITFVQGDTLTC